MTECLEKGSRQRVCGCGWKLPIIGVEVILGVDVEPEELKIEVHVKCPNCNDEFSRSIAGDTADRIDTSHMTNAPGSSRVLN